MRQGMLTVALLFGGACYVSCEARDLYLLIGQSNMAGRGKVTAVPRLSSERIWKFTKGGHWAEGVEPIHFDRPNTGAGPGLSFARVLADGDASLEIGLIPCAEGGSALARWMPGGDLYTNAVARTRAAMATGGRLRGILWHQGEADSWSRQQAESYALRLTNMVTTLRSDLGCPYVPFIAGEVGTHYGVSIEKRGGTSFVAIVNEQIKKAVSSLPASGWVSAAGLLPGPDGIHFTTESAYELGRRYAREVLRWQTVPNQMLEGETYGGADAAWHPSFAAHGFNLQGMRTAGPSVGFNDEYFRWMRDWGFNCVRLPLDYRCWVKDRLSCNREVIDERGMVPLDRGIAAARKNGLVSIICLHRIPGEYCLERPDPEPGNIYTDPDCLRAAAMHWTLLADRYRDTPRGELFFNLFNEPMPHKGSMEQYEYVCRVLIAAIRKVDPKRFVVVDGWAVGAVPVRGLYDLPGVGQATRGYFPGEFSHFGVNSGRILDYPPVWPPLQNQPDGRFGGPRWPDWHAPFTVSNAPAGEYALGLSIVSGPIELEVMADEKSIAHFALRPQPNHPDWVDAYKYKGLGPWCGTSCRLLQFQLAKPAQKLSVQLTTGDWAMPRVLVVKAAGNECRLDFSGSRKTKKNVNWNRCFIGGNGIDAFPPESSGKLLRGPYGDLGMDAVAAGPIELWREPVKKGVWCLVGEFGCANCVRHKDAIGFIESNLKVYGEIGIGWCGWGFIGSRFGILNSGRADVAYEDWHGQKLDRKMLAVLQKYLGAKDCRQDETGSE